MRTVVLYIAMSLDGYIADQVGGVGWLAGDGSDNDNPGSYPSFIEHVDTVIMGYKTYHQIITELSPESWVYAGKKSYVVTHSRQENTDEVTFTEESLPDLIIRLKWMEGKDIWICGGASIVQQLMQQGLIDRFHISIIPTLLGTGIPLFGTMEGQMALQLVSTQNYNGIVDLVYQRR